MWGSLGSLAGGSTGWFIGRYLAQRIRWVREFMAERGQEAVKVLHRGGALFLGVAALTPLPYSIVCWAAGATRMPFLVFFAVSMLRPVRVTFYLWLIERGFFSMVS